VPKPLAGYRVVDFTHVLAGPFATNMLVQLGADVIKIEAPERGDTMRYYGIDEGYPDMAPPFIAVNSGKRSITLDLKSDRGKEAARRLVAGADVVVENFRPGVISRLGFGYEDCKKLNPNIILCSMSGFGQSGPLRDNPAIDQIIQSVSGVMSLSGEPGSPSTRVGFPVVDTFSGAMGAFAIVTALFQRERFGGSQYIDVSMLDSTMVMMFSIVVPYLITGKRPEKYGNRGFSLSPTADTFPTCEGEITVGAVQQGQFERLCALLGCPEIAADPRFADKQSRIANGDALRREIVPFFAARTALEWEQILNEGNVPAGAVREVPEAINHPHIAHRKLLQTLHVPALARDVQVLGAGFRFEHDGPGNDLPPPGHGQHTREILKELGLEAEQSA